MAERSWGIMSLSSKWQSSSIRVELWGSETCDSSFLPKSSRLKSSKTSPPVKEPHNDMDLMVESAWSLLHALPPHTEQHDMDLEEYVVAETRTFDLFADVFLEPLILETEMMKTNWGPLDWTMVTSMSFEFHSWPVIFPKPSLFMLVLHGWWDGYVRAVN